MLKDIISSAIPRMASLRQQYLMECSRSKRHVRLQKSKNIVTITSILYMFYNKAIPLLERSSRSRPHPLLIIRLRLISTQVADLPINQR